MHAAQLTKYSPNYQLTINELPIPTPQANEVLIKVKSAAVNPLENLIGSGQLKLLQSYHLPVTMGNEIAGTIEQIGSNVTEFKVGDPVYSRLPIKTMGGFADFVITNANAIAPLPSNLDYNTGAAAALTGLTAYQAFHEELHATKGQTVFIPGGSGSFGQMAIPIAKSMGLTVIVSGNARSREKSMAIGADQYLDYRQENYWDVISNVDYVIDTLGAAEFEHELSVLKRGGTLLSLKTGPNKQFALDHHLPLWKTLLFTLAGEKYDHQAKKKGVTYRFLFVRSDGQQLRQLTKIIEDQNIIPSVDPTSFELADINAAINYMSDGHPKGKVEIQFNH